MPTKTKQPRKAAGRQPTSIAVGRLTSAADISPEIDSRLRGNDVPDELSVPGRREMLPLGELLPSPTNPRKHFAQEALERLAASLKNVGLLQDLVVRQWQVGEETRYEVIAGERRFRAAQLAGLTWVPCRIVEVSDAQALEIQAVENLHREQLNEIEEAITYKQLCDVGGYTQTALAERFQITQGQVSNRIRLLELPEVWQQRVIDGSLRVTDARELVPFAKSESVLEALEGEWLRFHENRFRESEGPPERYEWENLLEEAIHEAGRNMGTEKWRKNPRLFKLTPQQQKDLQIVTAKWLSGEWALNSELYDQLQEAAEKRQRKRADKEDDAPSSNNATAKGSANPGLTEQEKREQFEKRLYRWKIGWLQERIHEQIQSADQLLILKCLLYLCVNDGNREKELDQTLKGLGGKTRIGDAWEARQNAWAALSGVPLDTLPNVARQLVVAWSTHTWESFRADTHPDQIEALAAELGIDIETDWRLDRSFLELHTKDQLAELIREWKLRDVKSGKRSEVIDDLLTYGPACSCPQSLIKLKRPKGV